MYYHVLVIYIYMYTQVLIKCTYVQNINTYVLTYKRKQSATD